MSFSDYDSSRAAGRPVEIYKFTYGAGASDYYAHTDAERSVVFDGVTYTPQPLDRDRVKTDGGKSRKDLTIYCSALNPVLGLFQVYPPNQAILVQIRAGHLDDPDNEFVPIWNGRVLNVKTRKDKTGEITCRPMTVAGRQAGLRRNWQLGCPLPLYGQGDGQCNASKAAATSSFTPVEVGSAHVVMPSGWAAVPANYVGGMIEWTVGANSYSRTILRIDGDGVTVRLSGYTNGLTLGDSVDAVLGCPHNMTGCADLHSNILNYGGQDWIPLKNPVNTNPYV